MTRNEMRNWIGGCMKQKGFHDPELNNWHGAMVRVALIGTEVAEVIQEFKRHWKDGVGEDVIDRIAKELADTAIRAYDLAFVHGLDLSVDVDDWEWPSAGELNSRHVGILRGGFLMTLTDALYDAANELANENMVAWRVEEAKDVLSIGDLVLLTKLEQMAEWIGRDLNKAIEAKMAENMARPHKYGTPDAKPVADSLPPIGGETVLNNKIQDIISRLQAGEVVTVVVDGCGSTCNSLTECSQQIEVVANASDSVSTPGD